MTDPVEIATWLASLGFESPEGQARARSMLEASGLTRPGKQAIAPEKLERGRQILDARLVLSCRHPVCLGLARETARGGSRLVVEVGQRWCSVCEGSNNRRAVRAMAGAARRVGVARILVLGGTPAQHAELRGLLEGVPIELRTVDGVEHAPNKRTALHDLAWAQLMVVWASTPIPHKVSVSYTDECPTALPSITVARRGIEALCDAVTESIARRGTDG